MVYIDPVDSIPARQKSMAFPKNTPIHVISSNTVFALDFYNPDDGNVVIWHDSHWDEEIEDALDINKVIKSRVSTLYAPSGRELLTEAVKCRVAVLDFSGKTAMFSARPSSPITGPGFRRDEQSPRLCRY